MKVTLLGTGSPIPSPDRAGPATLIRASSATLLFDAGRGVVMRLASARLFPTMLDAVVLTHLHSDHVSDLNDVITTYWVMNSAPRTLRVVGPRGTRALVDATLEMLSQDVGYRRAHHAELTEGPRVEVTEMTPGDELEVGAVRLSAGASDHRPVEPSLAYRVDDADLSVVIGGDGVPCASLDVLVSGATAYVQSVIRDDLVRLIPVSRLQDILDYHSSVAEAAATAQRAAVKALMLTHYVPAPAPGSLDEWRACANAFEGLVVMGDDLTTLDLATMHVSTSP